MCCQAYRTVRQQRFKPYWMPSLELTTWWHSDYRPLCHVLGTSVLQDLSRFFQSLQSFWFIFQHLFSALFFAALPALHGTCSCFSSLYIGIINHQIDNFWSCCISLKVDMSSFLLLWYRTLCIEFVLVGVVLHTWCMCWVIDTYMCCP